MSDRRVHAETADMEVVRYDRAGKWYLEPRDRSLPRQRVTIDEAARYAVWGVENANGSVFKRLPGGLTFDAKYDAHRSGRVVVTPRVLP